MTPEELARLQALLGVVPQGPDAISRNTDAPPAPTPAPDRSSDPYSLRASEYRQQASALEQEAASPYPQPKGVGEHIVSGLRAGMENFGRLGAPGGYYGQEQIRQDRHAQENAGRLSRAKELRNQGQQQEELGQTVAQRAVQNKNQDEQLAETARLRAVQEAREKREGEADIFERNKPTIVNTPTGSRSDARGPDGLPIPNSTIEGGARPDATPNYRDVVLPNGHAERRYFGADPSVVTYKEDLGPKPNASGDNFARQNPNVSPEVVNYFAEQVKANPLNWSLVAGNETLQAQVRQALAAGGEGVNFRSAQERTGANTADQSYNLLKQLETAYKPEFVGPLEGRYETSKSSGLLSFLPFFKTPEGYGEFKAITSKLKNALINLITGAAVGVKEEMRILGEMPTENDKDEMWVSKYQQTMKNTEYLRGLIEQNRGRGDQPASGDGQPTPGAPPAAGPKRVRIQ